MRRELPQEWQHRCSTQEQSIRTLLPVQTVSSNPNKAIKCSTLDVRTDVLSTPSSIVFFQTAQRPGLVQTYLFLAGPGEESGVVLGRDAERLPRVQVEVLDEWQVAAARRPDLVLDRVQHFDVQQLELKRRANKTT